MILHALHIFKVIFRVTNPSHVSKDKFTIGAVDNFDNPDRPSLSGKFSNHGTTITLFQVKPPKNTDETQIDYTKVTMKEKKYLPRKSVIFRIQKNIKLSSIFKKKIYINEKKTQDLENLHFIVKAIKSMFLDEFESSPTWTTCISLVSKAKTPLMCVGFLPYLP